MTRRLAWIGLGRQGEPMARRLVEAGHAVTVWDRDAAGMAAIARAGARIARSAADAGRGADAVFLCLPGGEAIDAVLFGADPVLADADPGAIVIDHSSVSPALARVFADRVGALPTAPAMLDAPVSGGPAAAASGSLVIWAGGARRAFDAARPWMLTYAAAVHHMGAAGGGQIAKACHQVVAAGSLALWEEALRLALANGLDPMTIADAMEGAAADSLVRRTFARGLAAGEFPSASLANMTKDLVAAQELAAAAGVAAPMARAALDQFRTRIAHLVQPAAHSARQMQESKN